jgi:chlorite dismutase
VSNERYVTKPERVAMTAPPIGRPEAVQGALIPIKKSSAWWALAQDERRAIFEERSRHIVIGMRALPQVSRRLHDCRDLPDYDAASDFDFLTWFDFAPSDAPAFDRMLEELRASEEWSYVEREVEIRVSRAAI